VSDGGYSLTLRWDTDDPEFNRGFEAGEVFCNARAFAAGEQRDCDPDGQLVETVHATNALMMIRIAEAHGLAVRSEEVGDGWMHVVFTRTSETEAQA
jgi:hypothetical protein